MYYLSFSIIDILTVAAFFAIYKFVLCCVCCMCGVLPCYRRLHAIVSCCVECWKLPDHFLHARCPSCRPTNSVKALKATSALHLLKYLKFNIYHMWIHATCRTMRLNLALVFLWLFVFCVLVFLVYCYFMLSVPGQLIAWKVRPRNELLTHSLSAAKYIHSQP